MSKDTPAEEVNKAEPIENAAQVYTEQSLVPDIYPTIIWSKVRLAFIAGASYKNRTTNDIDYELILSRHSKNYKKTIEDDEKTLYHLQLNGFEAINAMKEVAAYNIKSSPPDAGKEQEAVAFAEWIAEQGVEPSGMREGCWYGSTGTILKMSIVTTAELYTLYKQNK